MQWEGDGTTVSTDNTYWLNQAEIDKPGEHIVYTYGGEVLKSSVIKHQGKQTK